MENETGSGYAAGRVFAGGGAGLTLTGAGVGRGRDSVTTTGISEETGGGGGWKTTGGAWKTKEKRVSTDLFMGRGWGGGAVPKPRTKEELG